MQKLVGRITILTLPVIAAALCVLAWQGLRGPRTPELGSTYQSVALMNGQLFFGRLEAGVDEFVVLRDVYYIQSRQNPDTKAIANVLIKRGGEAHQPDRMAISRRQILLIEPVKADSPIAKLIAEQHAK